MITVFDAIDAALLGAVAVVAACRRAHWAATAVAALFAYHLLGRWIAWREADPLPVLGVMQGAVAFGYLVSPLLSNYGRIIGSLFVAMSLSSLIGAMAGIVPQNGQGLGVDLWNFQSACLDAVAVIMIIGMIRRDRLAPRHGPFRRRA